MKLPPAILISETDFHNAWARAVRNVLRDGKRMTIGDPSEPKPIKDACVLFELTGNAIKQIEARELHPQFPFRHTHPADRREDQERQRDGRSVRVEVHDEDLLI